MNLTRAVKVGEIYVGGNNPLVLIAGPCVLENLDSAIAHAEKLKAIAGEAKMPFIFKSSYDKANRTSAASFRGPGLRKGLEILSKVKEKIRVPVLSDVHCRAEIPSAAEVLDVIQIPAFLSRQTDLIITAAETGKPINIKKGQFLAPWDMKNVTEKIRGTGNENILLTERGTSFGYNTLVVDMRSLEIMAETGCPVIFDGTHSVQAPGGKGTVSGGERKFVPCLSRAAVAAGCDGIFFEVHEDPDNAPSDGPNMLRLSELKDLLLLLKKIDTIARPLRKQSPG